MTRFATASLLVAVVASLWACAPATPTSPPPIPSPTASPDPAFADSVRFRLDFGLRADDAWVRAVAADPSSSATDFGVPLLPAELAELNRRAQSAEGVTSVVSNYGDEHPAEYGGVYTDTTTGTVVVMFTENLLLHERALRARLRPGASFEVRSASFTLRQLEALHDRLLREAQWFETLGAELGSLGVDVPANSLYVAVRTLNTDIGPVIEDHFGAAGMIDFDWMPPTVDLPRGSLAGTVVNVGSTPIDMVDLVVRAIGEHGDQEPDGGVAYGVAIDGTFAIPRLAATTWDVSIIYSDPAGGDPRSIGSVRAVVVGGQTTRVTIPIDAGD